MNWPSRRGRIRLMLTALLTALAVCIPAGAALAVGPPNESTLWAPEKTYNGIIQTPDAPAQAYNGNNLMEVWRGFNNHIYFSLNHGPDIEFGTNTVGITNTLAGPRVVAYGPDSWAVFHTGVDGHIYWMILDLGVVQTAINMAQTSIVPSWQALPGTTTVPTLSPDVTATGPGSYTMLVTYRSSTNTQLYSQWYSSYPNWWLPPQAIPNATSNSTPAIVWNAALNAFILFFRGTNDGLYYAAQIYGLPWSTIAGFGPSSTPNGGVAGGPSVMALSNGDMQIAVRDASNNIYYLEYYAASRTFSAFTQDRAEVTSSTAPQLVGTEGNAIWALASIAGYAFWKLSMKEDSLPNNHLTTGQLSAERAAFERALTPATTR
jgi:hypothetical protein